jgi:hypothetical protein
MSQLEFLVWDHEHLRSLLVRCEPENRSAMYELRPSPLRGGVTHLQAHPAARWALVHCGSRRQARARAHDMTTACSRIVG